MRRFILAVIIGFLPILCQAEVNIVDFGADPTGVLDSTEAIQDAIEATFAPQPTLGVQQTAGKVVFPTGIYRVSTINATNLNGLYLEAVPGTVILYADQQTTSMPVIDLTGSVSSIVEGIIASGQKVSQNVPPNVVPSTGFLISDTVEGGRSTKVTLKNVGTIGWFAHAALYMRGATDSLVQDSAFQQYNPNGHTLYLGGVNPFSTPSHANLAAPFTSQITSDLTFFHCEFHGNFLGGQSTYTTRLWDVQKVTFLTGLSDATGGPGHVILNGNVRGLKYDSVLFYSEGASPAYTIIENQSNLNTLNLHACSITGNNASSGPAITNPFGHPIVNYTPVGNY